MKWRVIQNKWNLKRPPWTGAIGIEEDDDELAVPAIVCWFTRGWPLELVQHVVDAHNLSVYAP
jgi:hypothetical protein